MGTGVGSISEVTASGGRGGDSLGTGYGGRGRGNRKWREGRRGRELKGGADGREVEGGSEGLEADRRAEGTGDVRRELCRGAWLGLCPSPRRLHPVIALPHTHPHQYGPAAWLCLRPIPSASHSPSSINACRLALTHELFSASDCITRAATQPINASISSNLHSPSSTKACSSALTHALLFAS